MTGKEEKYRERSGKSMSSEDRKPSPRISPMEQDTNVQGKPPPLSPTSYCVDPPTSTTSQSSLLSRRAQLTGSVASAHQTDMGRSRGGASSSQSCADTSPAASVVQSVLEPPSALVAAYPKAYAGAFWSPLHNPNGPSEGQTQSSPESWVAIASSHRLSPRVTFPVDISSAIANLPALNCAQEEENQSLYSFGSLQRSPALPFSPPVPSASPSATTHLAKPPPAASTPKARGAKEMKRKNKDPEKPSRPLSGYNLFFRDERAKLLMPVGGDGEDLPSLSSISGEPGVSSSAPSFSSIDSESLEKMGRRNQVGFEKMGQIVSSRWNTLDATTRARYQTLAEGDRERYQREMKAYRASKQVQRDAAFNLLDSTVDEETRLAYLARFEDSSKKKARTKKSSDDRQL